MKNISTESHVSHNLYTVTKERFFYVKDFDFILDVTSLKNIQRARDRVRGGT